MKKLLIAFLSISVLISACKEEEEPINGGTSPTPTYAFTCKIDGDNFKDNDPLVVVDPSTNVLTIDASDGESTIRIIVYNFSTREEGVDISLNSLTDKAYVTVGTSSFTNTQSGKINFSEIGSKISGTFNVNCNSLQTFESVVVTEGEFEDLSL
jgi:hypothetical protein